MEKYDVVVIGSGVGGYPAAIRAAQFGAKTAIIEKDLIGGTCLNWGCIPTKALIACSSLLHHMQHPEEWCLKTSKVSFDYAAMVARNFKVVNRLVGGVEKLLNNNKVTLYRGVASFVDRKRIAIAPATRSKRGKKTVIEAAKTIIATGGETYFPDYLPKHKRVLGSKQLLQMTTLPKTMLVMGAGVVAVEFACIMAQLGVQVTLVKRRHREKLGDILRTTDPDVREVVRDYMTDTLGIRIFAGDEHGDRSFENIKATSRSVSGVAGGKKLTAEYLLAAIGRKPVTEGLNLEKIGVETNARGYIIIDDYCRTSAPSIYAVGDVTPGSQLAHGATSEGITAAENACGAKRTKKERLIPECIFTSPEIGQVGLKEQEAHEKGIPIRTAKWLFSNVGKSVAAGDTRGFVKWIIDPKTDRLLGAYSVGAHGVDLIAEAAVAIRAELTVKEVARTVHCHPTISEAWMEAAEAYLRTKE